MSVQLQRAHRLQKRLFIIAVTAAFSFFVYLFLLSALTPEGMISPLVSIVLIMLLFNGLAGVCISLSGRFDRSLRETHE